MGIGKYGFSSAGFQWSVLFVGIRFVGVFAVIFMVFRMENVCAYCVYGETFFDAFEF